jgi:hypothetical protein
MVATMCSSAASPLRTVGDASSPAPISYAGVRDLGAGAAGAAEAEDIDMIRVAAIGLVAALVCSGGTASGQSAACDRGCLRMVLMRYMNAVAANEPKEAGIIVGFRQTENAEVRRVGTGAWQTVTGLGSVQRYFFDPVTGQAAYFGLVDESGEPAVVSVRIRVADRLVTEAEWFIGREGQAGMAADGSGAAPFNPGNLLANPPPAERDVPPGERLSRESLLGVTNSYFDAITSHDPAIMLIQPTCQRIENGLQITGRELPAGSDDGYEGRTNCSSGIRTTGRLNIRLVAARRYPLVDEVQQVVMGFAVFIREPESVNRRLGLSEFFYIDDQLISAVYAAMFYAAPDQPVPNWPPYDGNFPLPPRPVN